jgi:hypothetical protein
MHFHAEGLELLRDDAGGAVLLESELGMRVDVAPPGRHVCVQLGDAGDQGHGGFPF